MGILAFRPLLFIILVICLRTHYMIYNMEDFFRVDDLWLACDCMSTHVNGLWRTNVAVNLTHGQSDIRRRLFVIAVGDARLPAHFRPKGNLYEFNAIGALVAGIRACVYLWFVRAHTQRHSFRRLLMCWCDQQHRQQQRVIKTAYHVNVADGRYLCAIMSKYQNNSGRMNGIHNLVHYVK